MKINIQQKKVSNPTLRHLIEYLNDARPYIEKENVFKDMKELANEIINWKREYCLRFEEIEYHWGDKVIVTLYANNIILVCDERSGEFFKVSKTANRSIIKQTVDFITSLKIF
jgi:hypothetical protein